ncbi:hypothetical protein [Aeromonas hydrophila]|jgi:mRNA-degrading endonuclease RelE of RelBE toxin-antitoxin system|uniref:hypothetical protein n=1 Tax=Aeromonas hydrophila TaxID=644 RepID=UPI00188E30C9|nr:hypothetical protein [Aeromonas hydrophila]MBF4799438.1 hypothetical protein [Aeromonas hydrophila]
MNPVYTVQFTESAIISLEICKNYKTKWLQNASAAQAAMQAVAISAASDLESRPLSFQECFTARMNGLNDVRERNSADGYRTLFTVDTTRNIVYVMLVLHQQQDIVLALTTHSLIR